MLSCNMAQKGADVPAAATSSRDQSRHFRTRSGLSWAELGLDPNKEGEAIHYGPVDGNLDFYGGWFYFVGEFIEVGERLTTIQLPGSPSPVQVGRDPGEGFQYWFSTSFARPPAIFGSKVGAVEFITPIPWVLDEPYDPAFERKMDKAEEIMARYRKTLRDLAK